MATLGSLIPWRDKSTVPVFKAEALDPFASFRRDIDRLFDSFFDDIGGRSSAAWNGQGGVIPAINVKETDKEVVVTAELPGLDNKDFNLTVAGDLLTIQGEKKAETDKADGDVRYYERHFGSFLRSVRLPFEVGDEKIEARYDKGVLTISIPKPADAQRAIRRIEVNSP